MSYSRDIVSIPADTTGASADVVNLGTGVWDDEPMFGFQVAHGNIYAFFSEQPTSWEGDVTATGMKVIEQDGTNRVIRDICLTAGSHGTLTTEQYSTTDNWATSGDCVSYGFTEVRLGYVSDGGGPPAYPWEVGTTPAGMIVPADVLTAFATTNCRPKEFTVQTPGLMEGPENTAYRDTLDFDTTAFAKLQIASVSAGGLAQGATHMRIWRSRIFTGADRAANSLAATKFYVKDLPLIAATYSDKVTDAALEAAGTAYQLTATDYSNPPIFTNYTEIVKNRLILWKDGVAYASEAPGGDGGHQLTDAYATPEKWFGWFKPLEYRWDCDSEDGQKSMGCGRVGDDLILFKETKTYAVLGGEVTTKPTLVSSEIGCAFPLTITKADVLGYFGKCIFFMSNKGPAVISEGANLRLLTEFKIAELWPDKSTELYGDLLTETKKEWILRHCTANYFKNNWHVLYKTYAGTKKWFCMYYDPAKKGEIAGPWKLEYSETFAS
jgi:hypothetical protein